MRRFLPLVLNSHASKSHTQQEVKYNYLPIPRERYCHLLMSNVSCACIIKINFRWLIFLPKTHEQLKIFRQLDSQLLMNNIHHSQWKFFIKQTRDHPCKNIGSKSQNDLIVNGHQAENEIVPLQRIHSITFEQSTRISPIGKL